MKKLLLIASLLFSFNAAALDEYGTLDEGIRTLITSVVSELKLSNDNDTKMKIYNAISFVFTDDNEWSSYWIGYGDTGNSRIKSDEITYIEQFINTSDKGMFFLTFVYDKKVDQLLLSSKQIRHGTDKEVLGVFSETKNNTSDYELIHERDNFAMTQKSGYVDFAGFSVMDGTGSIVYFDQIVIDL
ncbi:hypothetical protein [Alteromonas sp. C1M14]|uniref:hypothetical protein n=1 Tax=Alteromonas sp. C1M14 TaxID=2841567 RepID=UPI001C0946D7|nr:hypothetical protein [Alteromonas sp. C1M14]MBU2978182.1 hypothetical protein [Alteromonas sp. C1M14]